LKTRKLALGTILGGVTLLGNLTLTRAIVGHRRNFPKLSVLSPESTLPRTPTKRLSIIVPARDEAMTLQRAAKTLLHQDWPNIELLLIDDRSTDGTGQIIDELAAAHPGRVRAIHIAELPPDWLGKNYALWRGAREADGDWFLFTDADIEFDPTTLRRAIAHAEHADLDHLALLPGIIARGYWLRAFLSFVLYAFIAAQRPHLAKDPQSGVGIGLGAFNLLRRPVYEAIGTYAAVSLRPDDDMRLGRRVKQAGFRQEMLSGTDLIRLEWYTSLRGAVLGLEKNQFANLDYSVPRLLGSVGALWLLTVYPYIAVWRAPLPTRTALLAAIAVHTLNYTLACYGESEGVASYIPALPAAALLVGGTLLRSGYRALRTGRVSWRQTSYPLTKLRAQTGLE
jgi:glycosyltransferase involved in cell wall biosynthesis